MKKPTSSNAKKPQATKAAGPARKSNRTPTRMSRTSSARMVNVRFEHDDQAAGEVFVAGSFNDWHPQAIPMKQRDGGSWTVEIPLEPGCHEYRFVVDGRWRDDPRAERTVKNPFGGVNGVIEVPPGAA